MVMPVCYLEVFSRTVIDKEKEEGELGRGGVNVKVEFLHSNLSLRYLLQGADHIFFCCCFLIFFLSLSFVLYTAEFLL